MSTESSIEVVYALTRTSLGVFRGHEAVRHGITRKQLHGMLRAGFIERVLPDTYRVVAVAPSFEQRTRAALLWAGAQSAAWCRSAGAHYGLDGVRPGTPAVVVPAGSGVRSRKDVTVVHARDRAPLMIRSLRGVAVTGIEATMTALAAELDPIDLEVACEDARRRRLTSLAALSCYLDRYGGRGRDGVRPLRALLSDLDPKHPSRSKLEVLARRVLVDNGLGNFVREFPLTGPRGEYLFDFAYAPQRLIVETNGRRWHDDPTDYEHDNEKWSVPALHGFRMIFATWEKVTERQAAFCDEVRAALAEVPVPT